MRKDRDGDFFRIIKKGFRAQPIDEKTNSHRLRFLPS